MEIRDKVILVTGANGMVGRALISRLLGMGCSNIIGTDIVNDGFPNEVKFILSDLRMFDQCLELTKHADVVFNLVGIKGSPTMAKTKPASFMAPMLQFNTNMLAAANINEVEWFLYTSSVGVYHPAEVFNEDDVWKTFPSENDKFPGWAKRMGELLAEAYSVQYGKNNISIIRPGNIYGPYDNFDINTAMVIPSLIYKSLNYDVLEVFGDGEPIRDFVYSDDVARGMIFAVENEITEPLNLSSGIPHSIKDVVDLVLKHTGSNSEVKWLIEHGVGDNKRLMNIERIKSYGFEPQFDLNEGIRRTVEWVLTNNVSEIKRYNPFLNEELND